VASLLTRSGGIVARLVLLVVVATATAVLAATFVLPPAVLASDLLATVERDVFDVPPLPPAEPIIENSLIFDGDGNEIAEISLNESRLIVDLDQIPSTMVDAVIATEDSSFREHNGVNVQSIARAFVTNQVAGEITSGASTITQQYVKNVYIAADRRTEETYDRKIQEALWAIQLEDRLTKDEILEGYLNRIALGQGVHGVGKAAERYFSVPVQQLSLGQSATLAGMIRSPEGNNPITNPENSRIRRDIVLGQMATQGFISQEQADRARAEPLGVNPSDETAFDEPWWIDFVTRQLYKAEAAESMGVPRDLLDALGDDEEARISSVFQGGLRIYTTLDPDLQVAAVDSIRDALTYDDEPRAEVAREPYGGLVSVVPGDGAITTMALGPVTYGSCVEPIGYDDRGRQLCDQTKFNPLIPADAGSNRPGRQPGSSFKPLLITAALEAGFPPGWTADATSGQLIEGPAECSEREPWEPNNFGGGGQFLDMYTGVKASSNVFHAKLISEVGPQKVVETARRMGIFASNITPVCSIALGSGEVFPLEMASAYATLAAGGTYCEPYAVTRIEDREGNLLYEHANECSQTVEPSIAARVIDIMAGPVTAGGTAPAIAGQLAPHPVRGKTGTTQDYRDAWFVGYVPQLATAAWVGYPNGTVTYDCERNPERCTQSDVSCFAVDEERNTRGCVETRYLEGQTIAGQFQRRVFGGTIPAPMWSAYMQRAMEGVTPGSFPSPGAIPGAVVPDLSNITTLAEMREVVEAANLRLFIESVPDWRQPNSFLQQTPGPGTSVQAGAGVVVNLSDGTLDRPVVPDVTGLLREAAQTRLLRLGFTVVVREVTTPDEAQDGRVITQSPEPGTPISGALPPPPTGDGEDGDDSPLAPTPTTDRVVIEIGVFTPAPEPEPGNGEPGSGEPGPSPDPDPGPGNNGNGNGNGNQPPAVEPTEQPS
jgi:membrane peptidoglycan carboxypeptidase